MSKYRALAERFIEDIHQGKLQAGSKMPSLRKLAQLHQISMTTAVNCYQEMESLGWLESRPQAGFFITSHAPINEPEWAAFTSQSAPSIQLPPLQELDGPFGISRLRLDPSTIEPLQKSFRTGLRISQQRLGYYPHPQGEARLRHALANHFAQSGISLDAEQLVITHGCLDAVKKALLATTNKGDCVAISSPCYNGLLSLLAQLERNIVEIPSRSDGIDLDQLEAQLDAGQIQAGLFCTTHMNPQGITMSVKQKQRLARLAAKYQTPIIEDDVYIELAHSDLTPLPASDYDTSGYMIWCGSVSKTLSPSYRLGWCYSRRYRDQLIATDFGLSIPLQYAIADFIASGHYSKHLKRAHTQLKLDKQRYLHHLASALPQGTRITNPDGGLVLWLQLPNFDSVSFLNLAEQNRIAIRAGHFFTASERYRDCLRLNIGWGYDPEQLATLCKLIAQHCQANIG